MIHNHHPGYLTWQDFEDNQATLEANCTHRGARPPREGLALCQGIILCGSCGRPMTTRYHRGGRAAYECSASRADQQATPTCRSIAAHTVDDAVTRRLLAALSPEQISLALAAAGEVTGRHARAHRAAELAVERVRYDADRAERAFHRVEPENRLVASTLEARWETRLAAVAEAETALDTVRQTRPPLPEPDRHRAKIEIRWHTAAIDLITQLGPERTDDELAADLTAAGLRTGKGHPFDVPAVRWARHTYRVRAMSWSRWTTRKSALRISSRYAISMEPTWSSPIGLIPTCCASLTTTVSPSSSPKNNERSWTMRAVRYSAPKTFEVVDVEMAPLVAGHARLKVLTLGVCGTDQHIHNGGFGVRFPMTPGHEFIGEVTEVHQDEITQIATGDRVACDNVVTCGACQMCRDGRPGLCENLQAYGLTHPGGAADFVDVPISSCVSVGALPLETAVLAEPTACVVHGLDVLQLKAGADVLVVGAGPTGQLLAQLLGSGGASRITVAAPTQSKLEVARMHGAHEVVRTNRQDFSAGIPQLRNIAPDGFDVVVDATGAGAVLEHCLPLVRAGGTFMVYGMAEEDVTIRISPFEVFRRELTIKGAFSQTNCVARSVKLLQGGRVKADGIVTHTFLLTAYDEALDALRDPDCLKAVVVPGEA
ncbi:hypothetical protein FDG2_2424 [Candidatus Protofrankia californiensis]|uniref:L-threonine 3-dehydrogenase n=1 Tax=Candidatus Protofrankia californiensis TaxID=1839754 RepID=A0A1C3NXN7_9ACTN|nr:hypothetical protein FDG2_2424 [Candidatus Protofrankia californiensis]